MSNKKEIPGPGAYQIASLRQTYKNGKFTKALRKLQTNNVPGPGKYESSVSSI